MHITSTSMVCIYEYIRKSIYCLYSCTFSVKDVTSNTASVGLYTRVCLQRFYCLSAMRECETRRRCCTRLWMFMDVKRKCGIQRFCCGGGIGVLGGILLSIVSWSRLSRSRLPRYVTLSNGGAFWWSQ